MQELDHRVCIVGAGPAGLVIGHILHQSGIPFVILERQDRADLRTVTKAGLIEQRVVEALKPFGLAAAPAAVSRNFGWTAPLSSSITDA